MGPSPPPKSGWQQAMHWVKRIFLARAMMGGKLGWSPAASVMTGSLTGHRAGGVLGGSPHWGQSGGRCLGRRQLRGVDFTEEKDSVA